MSSVLVGSANEIRADVARRLRVIWKDSQSGRNHQIGWLESLRDGKFRFYYWFNGGDVPEGFEALPQFPEFDREYTYAHLPAFFQNRVMNRSRGSASSYLKHLGVGKDDPIEEIARTGGSRVTDPFYLVDPFDMKDGHCQGHFMVSGLRRKGGLALLSGLQPGDELCIRDEPANPYNGRALLLTWHEKELGWIPNWLVDEVHRLRERGHVRIYVDRINKDAPSYMALLCRLDASITE